MEPDNRLWPIAVVQDRYTGTYSGGRWLAIANADTAHGDFVSRFAWLMHSDAYGDDGDASEFWWGTDARPDWLAVGETPEAAIKELHAKAFEARNGVRPGTRAFGSDS